MKKQLAVLGLIVAFPLSIGCGMCRSIEQWKCDNWGMCHFAPNRPGMYSPMSVQPTYGPPTNYGAPSGMPVASGAMPAGAMAPAPMTAPAGVAIGNPVNPNCKDCNR